MYTACLAGSRHCSCKLSGCGLRWLPLVVSISLSQDQPVACAGCPAFSVGLEPEYKASWVLPEKLLSQPLAPKSRPAQPTFSPEGQATPDTSPKHGFPFWSLETPGRWQPKQLSPSTGRSPSVGEKNKEAEYQAHLHLNPLFLIPRLCSLPPSLPLCCCQINEKLTRALKLTPEPQASI